MSDFIIEQISIEQHTCCIYRQSSPRYVFIQPVDSNDIKEMDLQCSYLKAQQVDHVLLVGFSIHHWNEELTPWSAPPAFGKIPFGNGATTTLQWIVETLMPQLTERYRLEPSLIRWCIGGYSLAGLFSLWVAYQTQVFSGCVAASPSAWYPNWLNYAAHHQPCVPLVYLSLGDKEHHTRTTIMASINECMKQQELLLKEAGITTILEWNQGNHFQDNGLRMAKGWRWMLNHF